MTAATSAVVLAAAAAAVLTAARGRSLDRLDRMDRLDVVRPRRALPGRLPLRLLRRRAAKRRDENRQALGELLPALVAELRAGAEPRAAVVAAASGHRALEPLVAAASMPSSKVGDQFAVLGAEAGGAAARELAAAWVVGERTGCGLAAPVTRVLRGYSAGERLRREIAAELAAPRATAYLLAGLPLVGVVLGTAVGADPAGFLLGSGAGRVVLLAGLLLDALGLMWTRQITRQAGGDG